MISHLTGRILSAHGTTLVLDVGGTGYRISMTPDTLHALKARDGDISLWTYLSVRESALELYGFLDEDTLGLFEMLISVSGVGPKSALAILSLADAETIRTGIRAGDHTYLTKVSGIGKKSADRIILELRDKLGALEGDEHEHRAGADGEVYEALVALGYSRQQARDALKAVPEDATDTGERLRAALRSLGNSR